MKHLCAVALFAVSLISVPRGQLAAQACSIGLVNCTLGAHHTSGGGQYGGNSHGECEQCLEYGTPVDAAVCHACPENNLNQQEQVAYAAVRRAAAHGNVLEVLKLAPSVKGLVIFNSRRNVVQVTNCTGKEVVGSLPITTESQFALASGLRRALTGPSRTVAAQ